MSAREEIRARADLFGWELSGQIEHDILVKADEMIDVEYRVDGSVNAATRYWFFSIDNLKIRDTTRDVHKKTAVIAWLAA